MEKLRITVLISGRGSNLLALHEAERDPSWPARIVHVISNEPEAQGLLRARNAGLKTTVINHRAYAGRQAFEAALHEALAASRTELVCLAGFLRLLTADFVERWKDRLLNIHPSLLPAYKGLDTHARVLADGVRITGCTVHFVTAEMDSGPIVVQAAVPVKGNDDAASLAARVLKAEHVCYPLAVRLVAERRLQIREGAVRLSACDFHDGMLVNPCGTFDSEAAAPPRE